jgi:hypothetical protein
MDFKKFKPSTQLALSKYWKICSYLALLGIELAVLHGVSDLPVSIGNWVPKAEQLASFQIPSDNFYGPGAAMLLVPFLWLTDQLFLVVLFYFLVGTIAYWKLTSLILNNTGCRIARAALPLNFYLLWLVNSSQDTVFEYCLLLWSIYFLIRKQYLSFSAITYLLSLTRAGYWTFFLGTSLLLFMIGWVRRKEINVKKLIAVPLLVVTSLFNYINFGSPSPALEGGMTAYFSYSKYHYLALPKMDMDVFLSGPKGIFTEKYGVNLENQLSGAQANSELQKAAIDSALANKKETLLGWMQKVDSYVFDVQKVPHLPGRYVLDIEKKIIAVENERLTWPLVIGNFMFFIYRALLICAGFLALGMLLFQKIVTGKVDKFTSVNWALSLPYVFGFVPGVLFYTETRFKIVSELLLVPLVVGAWSAVLSKRLTRSELNGSH